jgi:hypothetical protein
VRAEQDAAYDRFRVPSSTFTAGAAGQRQPLEQMLEPGMPCEAFGSVRARRPFRIDAIVILPDYLHCLWTLPPNDFGFFNPLAFDQVVIRARHRAGRAVINPKANETRTGCLATKILGACDPGSKEL